MQPAGQGAVLPICGEQKFLADLKREGYTCETLNLPKRIQRVGVLPTTKAILHHGRIVVDYQNRRAFYFGFWQPRVFKT